MDQEEIQATTPADPATEQAGTELAITEATEADPGIAAVDVLNWPREITEQTYELVTLPSGVQVRIDRQVTYGELLVSSVLSLVLVIQLGRWLWERIRGVL